MSEIHKLSIKDARTGLYGIPKRTLDYLRDDLTTQLPEKFKEMGLKIEHDSVEKAFADAGLAVPEEINVDVIEDPKAREQYNAILTQMIGFLDLPYIHDELGTDPTFLRRSLRQALLGGEIKLFMNPQEENYEDIMKATLLHKFRGNVIFDIAGGVSALVFMIEDDLRTAGYLDSPDLSGIQAGLHSIGKGLSLYDEKKALGYDQLPHEEKVECVNNLRAAVPFFITGVARIFDELALINQHRS